jgi:lysozyme family protein
MSDLQQESQQASQDSSESETQTQSSNSDQDILGNSAVQEILGFSDVPQNLRPSMQGVYAQHSNRTTSMMVGLTETQMYDMRLFLENWTRNKYRYDIVSRTTKMPAEVIAALHWRESSGNFDTYLHQGDPLGRPAVNHPRNIPVFYEWESAAVHALSQDYHKQNQTELEINSDTQNPNSIATYAEGYNGLGYHNRGAPSPYVYAGTDQYSKGKYVSDGTYSHSTVDEQLGVMSMVGALGGLRTQQNMNPNSISPEFLWRGVCNGTKLLRLGDNGPEVKVLQEKLLTLGFDIGSIDGDFGNGTKQAVISFQESVQEVPDGIVGRGTASAIQQATRE